MKTFGHVGIATATTIAAFVSLAQYVHGLKKRGFWQLTPELCVKMLKIAFCSVFMGAMICAAEFGLNSVIGNWLQYGALLKLCLLGAFGIFGLATFLIMAKITNVLDISEVLKLLYKRGKHAK